MRRALATDDHRRRDDDPTGDEGRDDADDAARAAAALLAGWDATAHARRAKQPHQARVVDVYFYSPSGQRFSSSVAVLRHLDLVAPSARPGRTQHADEELTESEDDGRHAAAPARSKRARPSASDGTSRTVVNCSSTRRAARC